MKPSNSLSEALTDFFELIFHVKDDPLLEPHLVRTSRCCRDELFLRFIQHEQNSDFLLGWTWVIESANG